MPVASELYAPARARRFSRNILPVLAACGIFLTSQPAAAKVFDVFGYDTNLTITGNYALSSRLEEPDDRVIDAPGRPEVPIAEELKFPESNNFDDGDRNFDQYALVNNRVSLLGQMQFNLNDDMGFVLRGDAFYDDVYNSRNDNDAPNRLNSRQQPTDSFTSAADYFSGNRARVLDAYAYASFFFGDTVSLSLKAGKHIAAWGQSLFFSGVALAQSTADATKATVPGADVKSILLPENQVSARMTLTSKLTMLAHYQFEHRPFELNPTGEFFTVADIVGPGAEFAYGIRNPFFPETLAAFNLTDPSDTAAVVDTIDNAFDDQLPDDLASTITAIDNAVPAGLPPASIPNTGQNPLNAPRGINPERLEDIIPEDGQYGVGFDYALNFTTTLGFYFLNYHNATPAPVLNFGGDTILIPSQGPGLPPVTVGDLGLNVPVSYNIRYFDDVKLGAMSISTVLFGANIGGELIYRDGVDVLVDVDNGVSGPVPTPTRSNSYQALLNAIYLIGPRFFWDSIVLVGETGYIFVDDVEGQPSQSGPNQGQDFNELTFDEDAAAFAFLAMIDKRGVFPGWDLQIPVSIQGQFYNRAAVAGTFGSLLGEGDYRFGIGLNFTRLQALTLGISYNGFLGPPDFDERPLQDRDTLSLTVKYNFL